jgi:hypothetical protein|tara:strand:- start:2768 stop:3391 length:624 start_codon:yes stop_codon:yes gene_type:complete
MMKKHGLFPTDIYEFRLDEEDMWMSDKALDFIKTLEMSMYNYPAGVRTSRGDIHKEEPMLPLIGFFHDCLEYMRCDLALQVEELKISLSWANWAPGKSGAGHPLHRHPYSYLSGVYYFTEGSRTVFQDPVDIRNLDTLEIIRDHFDGPYEKFEAEPGKLLIFPGWLRHFSEPQAREDDRFTMSFNALPHGAVNAGPQGVPMARINVL